MTFDNGTTMIITITDELRPGLGAQGNDGGSDDPSVLPRSATGRERIPRDGLAKDDRRLHLRMYEQRVHARRWSWSAEGSMYR